MEEPQRPPNGHDEAEHVFPMNEPTTEISADEPDEEEEKMIEPHAPHESVHTWKDVFIHIGIITVGLLLAIGLEQTVEFFHHRHQVAETREALRIEREVNIVNFQTATEEFYRFVPILQTDLAVFVYLRHHPGAPPEKWPGKLRTGTLSTIYFDSEWKTAQDSNVLQYMPQSEVRRLSEFYYRLKQLNDYTTAIAITRTEARRFMVVDPDPSHLTPEQLDHEIDLFSQLLIDESQRANSENNLHAFDNGFDPAPKFEDYMAISHQSSNTPDRKTVLDEVARRDAKVKALGGEGNEVGNGAR